MSEARNILAGRGFATDIAYYDEHHRLGRFPVPQTVFPPGFPLAIAAVARAGIGLQPAAFVVCLVAFNLAVALTFASVRLASGNPDLAALGGIVIAGSFAAATGAMQCNSEMLFLAATLAGLVCVERLPRGGPWPPLLSRLVGGSRGLGAIRRHLLCRRSRRGHACETGQPAQPALTRRPGPGARPADAHDRRAAGEELPAGR